MGMEKGTLAILTTICSAACSLMAANGTPLPTISFTQLNHASDSAVQLLNEIVFKRATNLLCSDAAELLCNCIEGFPMYQLSLKKGLIF